MQRPIMEGVLAGGASMIVALIWWTISPFHPLVIYLLYLIALFFMLLSTFWWLAKENALKEWFLNLNKEKLIIIYISTLVLAVAPLGWMLLSYE